MLKHKITSMPRAAKWACLFVSDTLILLISIWISFSIRFDQVYWPVEGIHDPVFILAFMAPIIALPIFIQFGLYRAIIRYLGMRATWSLVKAVALYALLWSLLTFLVGVDGVPRSVVIINGMVALIGVGGSRILARWLLNPSHTMAYDLSMSQRRKKRKTKAIIFGAGEAGRQLAVGINQTNQYKLLGFIDDNPELQGRELISLPIMSLQKLLSFFARNDVDEILLAIPSVTRKQRNLIIERLRPLNVRVRTLPGLLDMAQGQVNYSQLLDLDINDLLAREPAQCDEHLMQKHIKNQVVMVTGAGGSIGSEISRQILARKPKLLLLFELNEYALFSIHDALIKSEQQLSVGAKDEDESDVTIDHIIPLLGSVNNERRLNDIVSAWQPSIIYHAAALKHVPLVEQNVAEGVDTNIFGTFTLAKVAIENQVKRFVLISTDKAVNPTNVMGASKRCCELVLQALAAEEMPEISTCKTENSPLIKIKRVTQFSMVRFGNVLGSSGSVVPYFRKQIEQGGPITLTHPEITRYFMTIPEASQLVIQAGAMSDDNDLSVGIADHAEVYVLDMGQPVKIIDLARRMVELSGYQVKDASNPNGDIGIKIIGLRPGEKLYEELLIGKNPKATQHARIMKAQENYLPWQELSVVLNTLKIAIESCDVVQIRSILQQLVLD